MYKSVEILLDNREVSYFVYTDSHLQLLEPVDIDGCDDLRVELKLDTFSSRQW